MIGKTWCNHSYGVTVAFRSLWLMFYRMCFCFRITYIVWEEQHVQAGRVGQSHSLLSKSLSMLLLTLFIHALCSVYSCFLLYLFILASNALEAVHKQDTSKNIPINEG